LFIIGNGTSEISRSNILVVSTASVIVGGSISASSVISGSTLHGTTSVTSPIGNFTNLTASNISASGAISGSTLHGTTLTEFMVAVSDEVSNIASGSNKLQFIFPFALTGSALTAYVHTAPVGSFITCSARIIGGSTISASISGSVKSGSASTTYYINKHQEVAVDINQVGSTTAGKGLKLIFEGTRRI